MDVQQEMGMYRDTQQGKGGYDGNFMAINGYQWISMVWFKRNSTGNHGFLV